jgi:hypothetical protein
MFLNGSKTRTLYKVYGIRFIINVLGQAGKFSTVQLMLTCGACLGLLSVSSLIADFLTLSCFALKRIKSSSSRVKLINDDDDEVLKLKI